MAANKTIILIPHYNNLEELTKSLSFIYHKTGIEAMAYSLPLLMSDSVGNNDLVNQGINGYIFDSRVKVIEQIEFLKGNRKNTKLFS